MIKDRYQVDMESLRRTNEEKKQDPDDFSESNIMNFKEI
jgi:hypothetical protein